VSKINISSHPVREGTGEQILNKSMDYQGTHHREGAGQQPGGIILGKEDQVKPLLSIL